MFLQFQLSVSKLKVHWLEVKQSGFDCEVFKYGLRISQARPEGLREERLSSIGWNEAERQL